MLSGTPEGRPEASEVNKKLEMLATKEWEENVAV